MNFGRCGLLFLKGWAYTGSLCVVVGVIGGGAEGWRNYVAARNKGRDKPDLVSNVVCGVCTGTGIGIFCAVTAPVTVPLLIGDVAAKVLGVKKQRKGAFS